MKKSIYERVLNLRNRISLDGDNTIYEEDYLLLDEVLDLLEKDLLQDNHEAGSIDVVNRWDYEKRLNLAGRDIPKQAVMKNYGGNWNWEYECPVCKLNLLAGESYCPSCGQRIDWS